MSRTIKRKRERRTSVFGLIGLWLHAGGNWNNGTNAGSQARNANNWRWNTNTNIGGQFASDTGFELTPGWTYWPW